jgi:hypothetical protein
MNSTQTRYEIRTSKTTVALFDHKELAVRWLADWTRKSPEYARHLKLFKVVVNTQLQAEEV